MAVLAPRKLSWRFSVLPDRLRQSVAEIEFHSNNEIPILYHDKIKEAR